MDQIKNVRNLAILLAIAAAVYFLPGGGRAASTFEAALWAAFGTGIAYLGLRLYREHRISLYSLGTRHRGLFCGALALGVFELAARARMWQTGLGELIWFVLIAVVAWCLFEVYRFSRTY
ncbi:MAG: hypothetical protein ABSG95_11730 [Solirubrobacteraceae bacterium]|jgi:hypothetical protein